MIMAWQSQSLLGRMPTAFIVCPSNNFNHLEPTELDPSHSPTRSSEAATRHLFCTLKSLRRLPPGAYRRACNGPNRHLSSFFCEYDGVCTSASCSRRAVDNCRKRRMHAWPAEVWIFFKPLRKKGHAGACTGGEHMI